MMLFARTINQPFGHRLEVSFFARHLRRGVVADRQFFRRVQALQPPHDRRLRAFDIARAVAFRPIAGGPLSFSVRREPRVIRAISLRLLPQPFGVRQFATVIGWPSASARPNPPNSACRSIYCALVMNCSHLVKPTRQRQANRADLVNRLSAFQSTPNGRSGSSCRHTLPKPAAQDSPPIIRTSEIIKQPFMGTNR